MNAYRLISLYVGSERQNPYQKKQKAVILYDNYFCENLVACMLLFIIFQVKLSQRGERQWRKENSFACICERNYQNNAILICHQNDLLWMKRWFYSTLWYTTSWYLWGRVLHTVGQIKRASFWNGYITVSEPNTWNKMEMIVDSYIQVMVKYFWHD